MEGDEHADVFEHDHRGVVRELDGFFVYRERAQRVLHVLEHLHDRQSRALPARLAEPFRETYLSDTAQQDRVGRVDLSRAAEMMFRILWLALPQIH